MSPAVIRLPWSLSARIDRLIRTAWMVKHVENVREALWARRPLRSGDARRHGPLRRAEVARFLIEVAIGPVERKAGINKPLKRGRKKTR
jgi:hypothetical protein